MLLFQLLFFAAIGLALILMAVFNKRLVIAPVERKWRVNISLDETKTALLKTLELLKGKAVTSTTSDGPYFKYDFGSLLRSRIIGEFWVSRETLPKKVEICLARVNELQTEVNLVITQTHWGAFKFGFVDKYKLALEELADAIQSSLQ